MVRKRTGKSFILDRTGLLLVVFFIVGILIAARLFYLQIFKGKYFEGAAENQHRIEQVLLQRRGEIFMQDGSGDGNLAPVVINRRLSLVYAVPNEIKNPRMTAKILADILKDSRGECKELLPAGSREDLLKRCEERRLLEEEIYGKAKKENDPYEPIMHKVSEDLVNKIKEHNMQGIYFKDEWVRFYPQGEPLAQVSGFLGYKGDIRVGQYGIEGYWDKDLAGEAGKLLGDKDLFGRIIPVSPAKLIEARDGVNIVLTVDKLIQNKAYEIIKEAVGDYGAESGSILVMEPSTGKIKAMAAFPSFNPNKYNQVEDIKVFKNLNITGAYEPGSIFKVITMAAGLDSGAVGPETTYEDKGFVTIGEHVIHNADNKTYGTITMTKVLENSVNSGAIHVVMETGKKIFRDYVVKFGFGKPTGIKLEGESRGDISSLDKPGDIYAATASYGQGITVTPIQMAKALATVVNNGCLVQPKIVEPVEQNDCERVISEKTAQVLKAMMVSVVKNGHGSKAQVPGYYIGGKTGTAEIADSGGYSNKNNHSFIGFGPLDNTKFVIVVRLSKPKWGRFSAVTAAPTFQKMAAFLLQYYQIAPEYEE